MISNYITANLPRDEFPGMKNEDVIVLYKQGKCNFQQVLKRYHYLLLSKSLTHMPGMDSDDIYQELALRLLHCCDRWDPEKGVSFITYLCESCSNNLRWILRKQLSTDSRKLNYDQTMVRLDAAEYDDQGEVARGEEPYYEEDLEAAEFLAGLKLSDMEHNCIRLILAGMNNTEIGNTLGITRNRVSQILRGLGRRLNSQGICD